MKVKVYRDGIKVNTKKEKNKKIHDVQFTNPSSLKKHSEKEMKTYQFQPFNVQSVYNPKLIP